jgi:hypothetical protein
VFSGIKSLAENNITGNLDMLNDVTAGPTIDSGLTFYGLEGTIILSTVCYDESAKTTIRVNSEEGLGMSDEGQGGVVNVVCLEDAHQRSGSNSSQIAECL